MTFYQVLVLAINFRHRYQNNFVMYSLHVIHLLVYLRINDQLLLLEFHPHISKPSDLLSFLYGDQDYRCN